MNRKELADLLLPGITKTIEDYEKMYPERNLDEGAIVTRYAPSPTGLPHIGNLFQAFVSMHFAKQTNGVFYLRIEDTDQKRSIENGIEKIIKALNDFEIKFDEGVISETNEEGSYGPYIQSHRKEVYWSFAKYLIENDMAYPCFCSSEQLDEIRQKQEKYKSRIGYYGRYATCRHLSIDEIVKRVKNGEKYIIRLKSPGKFDNKFVFNDCIKGKMELPENDMDIIIIKSDGLPTYHFAHLVDDHLMRTTHVIRGDEWLSSVPIHTQLFRMFNFKVPKYAHLAPLLKDDNGTKRKLSKRKDPEASVSYYHEQGIPKEAVILYLATIANSNFEEWMETNKDKTLDDFKMEFKKMNSASGALFDLEKLLNISRNYLSKLSASDIYNRVLNWANEFDLEFKELLEKYKEKSIAIFNIEREQAKPRKDYSCYSDIKNQIWYMYDELFEKMDKNYEFQKIVEKQEIVNILDTYINEYYDINDDNETWFNKMKQMADKLGYASNMKEYKNNPENFKGNIADISNVIRVALTTKSMTPDLYQIMKILGTDNIKERFELVKNI